jgi:hypothetical protein
VVVKPFLEFIFCSIISAGYKFFKKILNFCFSMSLL